VWLFRAPPRAAPSPAAPRAAGPTPPAAARLPGANTRATRVQATSARPPKAPRDARDMKAACYVNALAGSAAAAPAGAFTSARGLCR
jgi:hypothetical protein